MAGPHCLIFERDVTGHRLHHVHHLAEALLEIGCDVTLALQSDASNSAEYQVHLKALEPRVRVQPGPHGLAGSLKSGWRLSTELMDTIRATRPDRVYITCTEYFTQAAALRCLATGKSRFPGPPIEGHLNRGTYAYPSESFADAVRRTISKQLALRSPWYITHLLDPWVYDVLKNYKSKTEFRVIPEPVEPLPQVSREEARRALGVPLDGRYLAMVGGLRPNKGLERFLSAFERANLAADDRVLLVGKMAAPIRELIRDRYDKLVREGRLVVVDRYVTDHELDCGFVAADVVAVTHEQLIGSSGTLVRAAHAERPLLTTRYGWAGWATETFGLGTTVNVINNDEFTAAIESSLKSSAAFRRSERGERFCRFHTLANQQAHWVAAIGRDCGIPLGKLAERVEWNWAMEGIVPPRT